MSNSHDHIDAVYANYVTHIMTNNNINICNKCLPFESSINDESSENMLFTQDLIVCESCRTTRYSSDVKSYDKSNYTKMFEIDLYREEGEDTVGINLFDIIVQLRKKINILDIENNEHKTFNLKMGSNSIMRIDFRRDGYENDRPYSIEISVVHENWFMYSTNIQVHQYQSLILLMKILNSSLNTATEIFNYIQTQESENQNE